LKEAPVSYSLEYKPDVKRFLRNYPGLSREGRIRLYVNIDSNLRQFGDYYRQDPTMRLEPGSDCFWYSLLMQDWHGDGRGRTFIFVVRDIAAVYGVLELVYVEVDEGSA